MEDKEDLRLRIYECLNRMGRYHILLLSAFGIFSMIAGFTNTVPVFYTFTPNYYCGIQDDPNDPKWNQCGNVESPTNCTFDPHENYDSIVTEYHLVCSNRYLAPLTTTMYFAGVTIGALIFGPLSDHIGRRLTLQIATIGHILMGLLIHFEGVTPTIAAFIVLRFFQGSFNQGLQSIAYTSLIELTPVKYRTFMGCLWEIFWALGLIYVGVISMVTYEWRNLQLFLLIPTACAVVASFLIPESLHWQWTQNQFGRVISSYSKIAERNGDKEFQREEEEFQRDKDWETLEIDCRQIDKEDNPRSSSMLWLIFVNTILRKHILIMSFFWFTVSMSYYAITFYLPNLAGNRHNNFIMGAGVEVIAYLLVYFAMNRYGRPKILAIFMMLDAALCISYGITELVHMDADSRGDNQPPNHLDH